MSDFRKVIEEALTTATGESFQLDERISLGGGCINAASRITSTDNRQFFIKHNRLDFLGVFEEEARGLDAMAATQTVRVPRPLKVVQADKEAFLIMEYLQIGGSQGGHWREMGRQLAAMHRATSDRFGWPSDNFIGSAPQINSWHEEWITFYRECRLQPQIDRARHSGLPLSRAEALLEALPQFLDGYQPVPSLLHGDLWAGNAAFTPDGTPVIFDPACYYGDREADLAMTEMFGGFAPEFYDSYNEEWPLHSGYRIRKQLYNLYHVLNHYNLFGGGYGSRAESSIASLLASLR